jgi:hypothetical protein
MVVGTDYRRILPASVSLGSTYLFVINTLARTLAAAEIPLSILTAVIGVPFFTLMLGEGKYIFGDTRDIINEETLCDYFDVVVRIIPFLDHRFRYNAISALRLQRGGEA